MVLLKSSDHPSEFLTESDGSCRSLRYVMKRISALLPRHLQKRGCWSPLACLGTTGSFQDCRAAGFHVSGATCEEDISGRGNCRLGKDLDVLRSKSDVGRMRMLIFLSASVGR
jgi:hypothetical protein